MYILRHRLDSFLETSRGTELHGGTELKNKAKKYVTTVKHEILIKLYLLLDVKLSSISGFEDNDLVPAFTINPPCNSNKHHQPLLP
jgi:hypothetical protein